MLLSVFLRSEGALSSVLNNLSIYSDFNPNLNREQVCTLMLGGRASSPVRRAAFKAVETLNLRLVGSTPTSSATASYLGDCNAQDGESQYACQDLARSSDSAKVKT